MSRALTVWWGDMVAGRLEVDDHGDISFTYAPGWVDDVARPALSLSLPKRHESFGRRECRPFFDGLLPEEGQRKAVAAALGVSEANPFKLLDALGGDVAGALTLLPEGQAPPRPDGQTTTSPLSEAELHDLLDELPRRPFLAGEGGLRLSLAGVQAKIPVVLVDGRIALPLPGQPTTHILKPPIARFDHTTENEAFAMRLAARAGHFVAAVDPRHVGGRPLLLVERYDRATDHRGWATRLHQEDFCQALCVPPERKYQTEGGPTFQDCFALVRRACTRPAVEMLKLLDAAILHLIIGNADAHGKNYSLLYREGEVVLAPLYDLLSTIIYPELSSKLAMKIAKRASLEEFRRGDWARFAENVGLRPQIVERRVLNQARQVTDWAGAVANEIAEAGFDPDWLSKHANRIADRARLVAEFV